MHRAQLPYLARHLIQYNVYASNEVRGCAYLSHSSFMGGSRGGHGVRTPHLPPGKSQVVIGFLRDSGTDPSREAIGRVLCETLIRCQDPADGIFSIRALQNTFISWPYSNINYRTLPRANNKGADQTARMHRLVCAFVVRWFLATMPTFRFQCSFMFKAKTYKMGCTNLGSQDSDTSLW